MGVLRIVIAKSFGSRSTGNGAQFSNVYHANSEASLDSAQLLNEVNQLVAWEKSFHSAHVQFMQATVSTAEHEPRTPYNPNTVRSIPLQGAGSLFGENPVADMVGIDVCLAVKHGGVVGRSGIWKYRGCLREFDVAGAGNGDFAFAGAQQQFFQDRLDARNNLPSFPELQIAHTDKETKVVTVRPILQIVVGGIMVTRRDRARKKKKEAAAPGA